MPGERNQAVTTIIDGRTRHAVALPSARDRLLRMSVHLPVINGEPGPVHARILVVADVLLRTLEADGHQLIWACEVPDPSPERVRTLQTFMTALGVHSPASFTSSSGEVLDILGGPADVCVFGDGRHDAEPGVWVGVGRVDGTGAHGQCPAAGEDLLAIRLGLLSRPYHRPVTLTSSDVVEADRTLLRWRERVAHWACSPSKPVPQEVGRAAADALAADLGTPAVLDLLLRAEVADGVPEGAKFETFASLDRILGLELIREIGRLPLREAGLFRPD
ncbi:hypothetical protein SAMN02787144_101852 [Streptomyces atratus]|uniref:Uncharacterized protein n=1 Tax=Streptomyces atratus TaxID=1893 RepID=A0A1K2ECQ5_STRAR|nr:hypothetical protein SAMN02787144_101852 [Streptomyces atratus]